MKEMCGFRIENLDSGKVPTTRVVSRYQPDGLKIPLKIPKPERARVLLQRVEGVGPVRTSMHGRMGPKHTC